MQADTSIDSAAVVDDAIGAVDVSNSLVYDMEAKLTAVGADSVLINDSEASNINKKATLTVVAELMAGTVGTSSIENTAGVLKVDVGNTTAATEPVTTNKVLVDVSGVNKAVTIQNLAKPIGEVFAATNATSGLSEVDGAGKINITGTTAITAPAVADLVLVEQGGVNKSCSLTNLAKAIGETMAGSVATSGVSEVDGVLTVAAKIAHLEAALLKGVSTFTMSFETNEQTTTRIYFPMKVTINKIRGIVMKAIAASDNGTITCGNSTGASTAGVVTATASDALNVEYSVSPSTNNVVLADGYYYLTSAKSTAGGKVLISLEWTRTA